jgi:hypothetical protein
MEQSPFWEANSHSVGQEILCLSWNLKIHADTPAFHCILDTMDTPPTPHPNFEFLSPAADIHKN